MRSRPTAVNLTWAVNRILQKIHRTTWVEVSELRAEVIKEALAIAAEDAQINRQMAKYGLEVVPQKARIIHHCNTGSLATVDYGTALGVIRAAHENGRNVFVYVDETRPRLQGVRLTAWELQQLGIPYTVIADGASGYFMRQGKIDLCFVGCDRVASNGDTANKIGTYNLALAAYAHGIPFYVVGPTSTVDLQLPSGEEIPIENRPASEITWVEGVRIAPAGADASNPAFDITPAQFITAIITEKGIAVPPYQESLARLCGVL
jgi:methylthioribose-1-phosphate isomerase